MSRVPLLATHLGYLSFPLRKRYADGIHHIAVASHTSSVFDVKGAQRKVPRALTVT